MNECYKSPVREDQGKVEGGPVLHVYTTSGEHHKPSSLLRPNRHSFPGSIQALSVTSCPFMSWLKAWTLDSNCLHSNLGSIPYWQVTFLLFTSASLLVLPGLPTPFRSAFFRQLQSSLPLTTECLMKSPKQKT